MNEKYLVDPEYQSQSSRNSQVASFQKAHAHRVAAETGLEVKHIADAASLHHDLAGVSVLAYSQEHYGLDAMRQGSISDRIDLPKIFSNETGIEDLADKEILREMANARGQVLSDE